MSTTKSREINFSFRKRLAGLRGNRSKAEFARFIGVSAPLYHQWENGATPTYNKALLIADKCGVSIDWLLGGKVSPPSKSAAAKTTVDWPTRALDAERKLEQLRYAFSKITDAVNDLNGVL